MTTPNDQETTNLPMNAIDDGWGDASDGSDASASQGSSGASGAGPELATAGEGSEATGDSTAEGARRRKRRRRRGGGSDAEREPATGGTATSDGDIAESADGLGAAASPSRAGSAAPKSATPGAQAPREGRNRDSRNREPREPRGGERVAAPRAGAGQSQPLAAGQPRADGRGRREQARVPRGNESRGNESRSVETRSNEARSVEARSVGRRSEPTEAQARSFAAAAELRTAPVAVPQRRDEADDNDPQDSTAVDGPWGVDDDSPVKPVVWSPQFASDDTSDSPSTAALAPRQADLSGAIANVTAVRFSPNGRITWFDAGTLELAVGEHIIVDSERGPRSAIVAVAPQRRVVRDRNIRRVMGVATDADRNRDAANAEAAVGALRIAKDRAAALKLPLKVFRAEYAGAADRGGKLFVYFTTDERVDVREFLRQISAATNARVELRQLGVRDEAKAVGGIGSCGLTLCCSTWLPDFVPVSIKMAKDQGLVLNPSKVSGQCGRLKCCLVYEQAGYAEMRKGLPKLGKRVISPRGEGRVVEVDVLRQRIRVSYGPGESEMLPAADIKPLFPSGNQSKRGADSDADGDTDDDTDGESDVRTNDAGPANEMPTT